MLVSALLTVAGCEPAAPKKDGASKGEAGTVQAPKVPPAAKVWFESPKDGANVQGPLEDGKVTVPVKMGVGGIAIKPAGEAEEGSGHHHIVIDGGPVAGGVVVPADDTHLHYGKGQTQAELKLAPGEHTLTMQFANGLHVSYGDALSATVKITVAESS